MREMTIAKASDVRWHLQSGKEAGRQLVKNGKISEDIQKKVSKELMPRDVYYKAAQEMMDQVKKSMAQ